MRRWEAETPICSKEGLTLETACEQAPMWGIRAKTKIDPAPLANFSFLLGVCSQAGKGSTRISLRYGGQITLSTLLINPNIHCVVCFSCNWPATVGLGLAFPHSTKSRFKVSFGSVFNR